jgi:hypothetical protein
MTYAALHEDFAPRIGGRSAKRCGAGAERSGILRRLVSAIAHSRQRQTDREIASFIARSGGRLTDDLERRMMQHLTTSDWSDRRDS